MLSSASPTPPARAPEPASKPGGSISSAHLPPLNICLHPYRISKGRKRVEEGRESITPSQGAMEAFGDIEGNTRS